MESGQGWKGIIQKRMYGAGSKCEVFSAGATDARANANASANVFDSTAKKKSLISFFVAAAVIHYWQQSFTQKSFPFWPQLQDCTLMVHYGTETAHSRCTLLNNSKLAETQCPANQRTSQQTQLPSHLPPWKKPSSVPWCSELDHSSLACPYWLSSFSSKKERHSCNQLWSTAAWNASSTLHQGHHLGILPVDSSGTRQTLELSLPSFPCIHSKCPWQNIGCSSILVGLKVLGNHCTRWLLVETLQA